MNAPNDWMHEDWNVDLSYPERRGITELSIEFKDPVYSTLPDNAVEGIRRVLLGADEGHALESVKRMNPQTLELVYHGDDKTAVHDKTIENVQETIEDFFGPLWRVKRKPDGRRSRGGGHVDRGKNIQRLLVRRMVARRFKYEDESETEYNRIVAGRPPGVPEDADQWRDLDIYPEPPDFVSGTKGDIYVYETSTGTQHLVRGEKGWHNGFRHASVFEGYETECGHSINRSELARDVTLTHYAEFVRAAHSEDGRQAYFSPGEVLDDLCGSCRRSHGRVETDDDGKVKEVKSANFDFGVLRDWEVESDD